jgi:hypothetical protein
MPHRTTSDGRPDPPSKEPALATDQSNKAHHLRQIQTIIRRMALASFMVKLWSTLVVMTILFISSTDGRSHWTWLAVFTSIVFWVIDAYVLRQVRLFKKNQARVRQLDESEIDFDMNTRRLDSDREALSTVLVSPSVSGFYLVLLGGVASLAVGLWSMPG